MTHEQIVQSGDIELWSEALGEPSDPAVLLIMGAEAQSIMWPMLLVERLVEAGRYVIRFDNRDVGPSSVVDFSSNPYTLNDMAADALAVMDHYSVDRAHVIGASMGGMITQVLMINHPERLLSATIIMSSPLSGEQMYSEDLPQGPFMEQMAQLAAEAGVEGAAPLPAPANREEYVAQRVAMFTALGDPSQVDQEALRQMFELEYERARDINSKSNHSLAIAATTPADRRPLLEQCTTPATVIHGENDPILPLPHGKAIADAIPNARFFQFAHMAHDLPEHCWDAIVESVG